MDQKLIDIVKKNHGGFEKATDAEIVTLFLSLPKETQAAYLKLSKDKKNAPKTEP